MARTNKIDNAVKKRFERQEKTRKENEKEQRIYFLIVCEGEKTEPNYFKAFQKKLPLYTLEVEVVGTAKNTLQVVEETLKIRSNSSKPCDSAWAVFDRDSFPSHKFDTAIEKAKANNVKCAYSNKEAGKIAYRCFIC
jgi:hypothetical protein